MVVNWEKFAEDHKTELKTQQEIAYQLLNVVDHLEDLNRQLQGIQGQLERLER